MSRKPALVRPDVLRWARTSSFATSEAAAKAAHITDAHALERAESGEGRITFRQLERLSKFYRIPLQQLYLESAPQEESLPTDFRSRRDPGLSTEIIRALRSARVRRDAAIRLFSSLEIRREPLPALRINQERIILDLLRPLVCATRWGGGRQVLHGGRPLSITKEKIEQQYALLVFELPVALDSFRGCSMLHDELPVIIVSSKDSANGRRFTIVHELVHLLVRDPGICTPLAVIQHNPFDIEDTCDRLAGEALVPSDELEALRATLARLAPIDQANMISQKFFVSKAAAAVRLAQQAMISREMLRGLLDQFTAEWERILSERGAESEGGPSYHSLQVRRLGPTFTQVVLSGLDRDIVSVTNAAELLGVTPSYKSIDGIREQMIAAYGA